MSGLGPLPFLEVEIMAYEDNLKNQRGSDGPNLYDAYDVGRLVATIRERESQNAALRAELAEYVQAMDKLYNHNEAVRAAVIQHFGIHHKPHATAALDRLEALEKVAGDLRHAVEYDEKQNTLYWVHLPIGTREGIKAVLAALSTSGSTSDKEGG